MGINALTQTTDSEDPSRSIFITTQPWRSKGYTNKSCMVNLPRKIFDKHKAMKRFLDIERVILLPGMGENFPTHWYLERDKTMISIPNTFVYQTGFIIQKKRQTLKHILRALRRGVMVTNLVELKQWQVSGMFDPQLETCATSQLLNPKWERVITTKIIGKTTSTYFGKSASSQSGPIRNLKINNRRV